MIEKRMTGKRFLGGLTGILVGIGLLLFAGWLLGGFDVVKFMVGILIMVTGGVFIMAGWGIWKEELW